MGSLLVVETTKLEGETTIMETRGRGNASRAYFFFPLVFRRADKTTACTPLRKTWDSVDFISRLTPGRMPFGLLLSHTRFGARLLETGCVVMCLTAMDVM